MNIDKDYIENLETLIEFRNQLNLETDRGCALMAASFLDYELEKLLREKLVGGKKHLDSLFDFSGPIGTISSKINISYSLGFISKTSFNDLNLIRKIRNDFGHTHQTLNFESENIKDKVKNLKSNLYDQNEIRSRAIFTNTVHGIMAEIHVSFFLDEKLKEKEDSIFLIPNEKKKLKEKAKLFVERFMTEFQKNNFNN